MLRFIATLAALWTFAITSPAMAQDSSQTPSDDNEVVLWHVDGADLKAIEVFRTSVGQALASERGNHILSEMAFREFVKNNTGELPGCFLGVEPCPSAPALAFSALGLSLTVRVQLTTTGTKTTAKYALIDPRGAVARESLVEAATPREAAFAMVREIFDATGSARFESLPVGATVVVEGEAMGQTPLTTRLPVGTHEYELRIAEYEAAKGEVEIRSGVTERVSHTFAQLPGVLLITDAPPGAQVFINDELRGAVGQPIELAPGTYAIEIRADGYETMRDAATIGAGEEMRRSAPLAAVTGLFSEFGSEAISVNNYVFRLGFEHGIQAATYQDARTDDEAPHELRSFTDQNGGFPAVGALERTLQTNGLRLDFLYSFKNLGVVLLSLSYLLGQPNEPVAVTLPVGRDEPGTLAGMSRLQLRPFQISYREFFGNIVPFGEIGMGIDFTWLDIESDRFNPVTLSQSEAFLGLSAGVQYFITPNYFALARYSMQGYFDTGLGNDHLLFIGFGAAFPNLFGFDAEPPEKL